MQDSCSERLTPQVTTFTVFQVFLCRGSRKGMFHHCCDEDIKWCQKVRDVDERQFLFSCVDNSERLFFADHQLARKYSLMLLICTNCCAMKVECLRKIRTPHFVYNRLSGSFNLIPIHHFLHKGSIWKFPAMGRKLHGPFSFRITAQNLRLHTHYGTYSLYDSTANWNVWNKIVLAQKVLMRFW